jgi:hypothetical protein
MNGEGSPSQRAGTRWVGAVMLGFDTHGRPVRKTVTASTKTGSSDSGGEPRRRRSPRGEGTSGLRCEPKSKKHLRPRPPQ